MNTIENNFKPRSFSYEDLGKLQEIISNVDCECPNHVSIIVNSLFKFEDYSQKCFNRNEQDAALHKLLYEKTAQARIIMEEALNEICKFENINL